MSLWIFIGIGMHNSPCYLSKTKRFFNVFPTSQKTFNGDVSESCTATYSFCNIRESSTFVVQNCSHYVSSRQDNKPN